MKNLLISAIFSLTVCGALFAQNSWDAGLEFQAYPTGLLPGIRLEKGIGGHSALNLRLGYNFVNHRDLGVQDDERGGGPGGTLGYRFYFKENRRRLFLGARSDIWFNRIDWKEYDGNNNVTESGTSKITVVQPTLEAGYLFLLGGDKWFLTPAVAFGAEVNVTTDGRETGQGAIFLIGISAGRRF